MKLKQNKINRIISVFEHRLYQQGYCLCEMVKVTENADYIILNVDVIDIKGNHSTKTMNAKKYIIQ